MHYLYAYQNKLNGKIYIGQTINPIQRFYQHKSPSYLNKKSSMIDKAIKKYGIDNFEYWIFSTANSLDEANILEIYWIQEMRNTLGSENIYNISDGGTKLFHRKWTPERKRQHKRTWANKSIHFDNQLLDED